MKIAKRKGVGRIMDYWYECILQAFEDASIVASVEQVKAVARDVQGSHENYSMYSGDDCIPNPDVTENEKLKVELKKSKDEQNKVRCDYCKGLGYTTSYGGTFQSDHTCPKCNGTGKVWANV